MRVTHNFYPIGIVMKKIANEMGSKIYTVSRPKVCLQSMDWGRMICI